jgi:hypothetical protein
LRGGHPSQYAVRADKDAGAAELPDASPHTPSVHSPADLWWEWAEKPVDSFLMINADIHEAVMALPPDDRRDRAKVNEAARDKRRDQPYRGGPLT